MKQAVIIVAGGKGMRMGADIPKQFLPIAGKPILMKTLERFYSYNKNIQIVLVLPQTQQEYWRSLCKEYDFNVPHKVANGGETRFHSVKNGLEAVDKSAELIGVHDGVRPFVSLQVIEDCYKEAQKSGAAIPVIDVFETVRHIKEGISATVPRNEYKLVQTPQVFNAELLRNAYTQPFTDFFTDDASVVEAYNHKIELVNGNRENIKITTPYDMKIAEVL